MSDKQYHIEHSWNFKKLILDEIKKNGGWVNAHVHADRAFTITSKSLNEVWRNHTLEAKWDLVDDVKDASVDQYCERFCKAFELMIDQGVTVVCTFVDVDPVAEDRALKGAIKARELYKDRLEIKYANQTIKGIINPEARKWFEVGAEMCDIIGALPRRDERDFGPGHAAKHLDIVLKTAKKHNKLAHIHVDQFNQIEDKETEQVADKVIEHDMQGKVSTIHSISIAAHTKDYREKVYKKLKEADISVIACPFAWIDSYRNDTMQPFHNALTPVDEMYKFGITVALGTDNIADYMVPFNDGNMWPELRLLAQGNRFLEIDELIKIATVNGRKVLGVEKV